MDSVIHAAFLDLIVDTDQNNIRIAREAIALE
jgi:hypothetical protein